MPYQLGDTPKNSCILSECDRDCMFNMPDLTYWTKLRAAGEPSSYKSVHTFRQLIENLLCLLRRIKRGEYACTGSSHSRLCKLIQP